MPTRRFHKKKRTTRKSRKTRRMMGGSGYMSVKRADVLTQIPDYLSKDFYILNGSKYKKIGKVLKIHRHVVQFKNYEVFLNGKNEIYYKYYKSPSSLSSMSMSSEY